MQPLISICVPIYNVALYIERCAHSLMQQTYENLEFIFVDDCSTDNSIELLQSVIANYPLRHTQVKIIHNIKNYGTAFTRKRSLEISSGDYIAFVDADDSIPANAIAILHKKAKSSNAEVVCGKVKIYEQSGRIIEDTYTPMGKSHIEEFLLDYFPRPAWGKLYKRSLLLAAFTIAPKGMVYSEDRLLSLYVCGLAKTIYSVQDVVYNYFARANSCSTTRTQIQFENLITFWQYTEAYINQLGLHEVYQDIIDYDKIMDKVHLLHFCKDIPICRKYVNLFQEAEARHPNLQLSRGKRLTRFLTKYHLWGFLRIYKCLCL